MKKKCAVFFDILMRPEKWDLRVVFNEMLSHFQLYLLLYWNIKLVLLNNSYMGLPVSWNISLGSISSGPANIPFVCTLCFFPHSPTIHPPLTQITKEEKFSFSFYFLTLIRLCVWGSLVKAYLPNSSALNQWLNALGKSKTILRCSFLYVLNAWSGFNDPFFHL